ncbi:hypothetical protein HMPREF0058_1876, partial [Actinomyces urogenitalis DSM 15434]
MYSGAVRAEGRTGSRSSRSWRAPASEAEEECAGCEPEAELARDWPVAL